MDELPPEPASAIAPPLTRHGRPQKTRPPFCRKTTTDAVFFPAPDSLRPTGTAAQKTALAREKGKRTPDGAAVQKREDP
jgi:hypothetical protein